MTRHPHRNSLFFCPEGSKSIEDTILKDTTLENTTLKNNKSKIIKDMNIEIFKHKKTGEPALLLQSNIKVKSVKDFDEDNNPIYEWQDGFVLYKTEYYKPEGTFFVRDKKDFYDNYEKV